MATAGGAPIRLVLVCFGVAAGLALALGFSVPARGVPPPSASETPLVVLPADSRAAATDRDADSWIVAGVPGKRTSAIGRHFGATAVLHRAGIYEVGLRQAAGFAEALRRRGLLEFAEPNHLMTSESSPRDPLSRFQWWLSPIVDPALSPPPVRAESPLLAIIDDQIDVSHPEFSSGVVSNLRPGPVAGAHGTNVAAVAGAAANGAGITGVWPGMRMLGVAPVSRSCVSAARAVVDAAQAGASVINMSYGFNAYCRTHHVATNFAFGLGASLVAAAGNDYELGNKSSHPATDPHVITVAALTSHFSSAFFSSANASVDVAMPGIDILTATPVSLDNEGDRDGYARVSGTSVSAPMVAAAAAWVLDDRPHLDQTQLTDLIRYSAVDLGPRGWDANFGFGMVQVSRTLRARAPRLDPLEPNEDIVWIDGRRFRVDPPIWRGGRPMRLLARLDSYEDPVDVYRVIVPPRTRVRVGLRSLGGDVDVEIYDGRASTVHGRRGRITGSYRPGSRVDLVGVVNRTHGRRKMYIAAFVPSTSRAVDPSYRLSVGRLR